MKQRRKKKLLSTLITGFLLCYSAGFAVANSDGFGEPAVVQQAGKTVTGTVADKSGEPVIGVSVTVQDSKEGAVTDVNGHYSIRVQDDHQILKFSYLGYKTVTAVAKNNVIDVILQEDDRTLNEIVVVGYGTQKKINLTGAVASVDVEKALSSRPVADAGRNLQGAVAGLAITIPSGEVGSDPVMRIRGQVASINPSASSAPLVLLDNVEISSISLVNPEDIESISILKDAASASIYGAKASLGVVLITTKKGSKNNKTTVSYSNNFAWSKVAKDIDMATIDGLEYALLAVERIGTNRTGAFIKLDRNSYERSKKWYEKYGGSIGPNDPYTYGRDWYMDGSNAMGVRPFNAYDYMIEEWTPAMTHNLSVNGSANKTIYHVGLGYFGEEGLMKTAKKDDFKRYNATTTLTTELSKYFTLRSGFLFSQRTKSYPYITNSTTADPWLYIYRWGSLQPFGYDDENILRSPASEAAQANTASKQYNYMNFNLGGSLNFTKNWSLEADYTFTNDQLLWNRPGVRYTAANTWATPVLKKDANGNQVYMNESGQVVEAATPGAMPAYQLPLDTYTGKGANPDHIYRESQNEQKHSYNIYTTYNLKCKDLHEFKFMTGSNIVYSQKQTHWTQKTELLDFDNPQFGLASGTVTGNGEAFWEAQTGFFGRINYIFNQKYLAEANLRYDGSSKFPTGLKWRYFPSFSGGWIASEESFMHWANPTLSFLKFRASWGIIGDQTVPNNLYVSTLPFVNSSWLEGTTRVPFYGTPQAVDPRITWQDFETLDLGFDARFFNGKLGITYDWYQRDTRNMISAGATLPYSAGVSAPQGNFSELRTKGWEITMDYNHRFKNGFGINALVTLSDASTYMTDYDDAAIKGFKATDYYKGKRIGDIWGYETEGLYQKSDFELDANGNLITVDVPLNPNDPNSAKVSMYKLKGDNPVYQAYLQQPANFMFGPGDVKYKDRNGDKRINNGRSTEDDPGDMVVIGNTTPRYQYGFRLGADYRGFDFSIFFQGVGKREVWGDGALALPGYNVSDGAMPQAIAGNFWREDRTDAFYPRPYNIGAVAGGSTETGNTYPSDRYVLNMAYLRIKNLTLGYSLSENLLKKVFLTKARLYVSLENIVTWDRLRGLPVDPEVINGYSMWNETNYNSSRTGVGAPLSKNVSFGLQLTF